MGLVNTHKINFAPLRHIPFIRVHKINIPYLPLRMSGEGRRGTGDGPRGGGAPGGPKRSGLSSVGFKAICWAIINFCSRSVSLHIRAKRHCLSDEKVFFKAVGFNNIDTKSPSQ